MTCRSPFRRTFLQLTTLLASLSFAVAANAAAPTFTKTFSPTTIGPGSISTATFTINNSVEAAGASALAFTDTLPANVTVATPAMSRAIETQ